MAHTQNTGARQATGATATYAHSRSRRPFPGHFAQAAYRNEANGLGITVAMRGTTDITAFIVEELYCEANVLADEVRAAFAPAVSDLMPVDLPLRRALECEGLKTTTRTMHVLAWLLNHRAYLAGQLSEQQWERHTHLPPDRAPAAEMMDLLDLPTQALVAETQRLHARVARIDREYRARRAAASRTIGSLHQRLDRIYAQG